MFIIESFTACSKLGVFKCSVFYTAVAQDLQDQEKTGKEDEAEQADSSLDPNEDRQHRQVQCEA